jgi:hypothetical protein
MRALAVVIVSLVLAAPAAAGGWATAGVAPPGGGLGAGETWNAEITLLQHGVTPLDGVQPAVIIRNGKTEQRFAASPTGEPGVYLAKVEFPSAGEWTYLVDDGFSQTHSYKPVVIGATDGGGTSIPVWPFVVGALALGLLVAAYFARRLRPVAAPAAQP